MSNINQELANFYKPEDLPPLLSQEEEHSLGSQIQNGETNQRENAIQKLVTSNLLLVLRIAQSYGSCLTNNGSLSAKDLVNEGNIGLMIAAKKFNPNKSKFSTYASFWIRQSMIRALCNKSRTIRLPVNLVQKSLKVFKYIEEYKDKHNSEPSTDQVSEATGINPSTIKRILYSNYQFTHLDSPMGIKGSGEKSPRTVGEHIEDDNNSSPFDNTKSKDDTRVINRVLNSLKPRERYIIEHRFGLNNKDVKTLEEIGDVFNVTRERIRQIEFDTMRKLRLAFKKEYKD